jgi:four helix bundle protein
LEIWQRSRELVKVVYRISANEKFRNDFELTRQIRRAAVSVMSNIAEGFERGGDKEFLQFLALAKGSCGEVRSQLYVALDQNYLDHDTFDVLFSEASEINCMISGFMKYLKGSELRGNKFK